MKDYINNIALIKLIINALYLVIDMFYFISFLIFVFGGLIFYFSYLGKILEKVFLI